MKYPILFCAFFASAFAFAQQKSSIDFVLGSAYTNTSNFLMSNNFEHKGKIVARMGIFPSIKVGNRVLLKTGLDLSSLGEHLKISELRHSSEFDIYTGAYTLDPSLPHALDLWHNHYFLEIPLVFRLPIGKSGAYFIETGLSPNFYLSTRTKYKDDLGERNTTFSKDTYFPEKVNFALILSFGRDFKLNQSWSFFLQPFFRYQFHLEKNYADTSFYGFGLDAGLRRFFSSKDK